MLHSYTPFGLVKIFSRRRLEHPVPNDPEVKMAQLWETKNSRGERSPIHQIAKALPEGVEIQMKLPLGGYTDFEDQFVRIVSSTVLWTVTHIGGQEFRRLVRERNHQESFVISDRIDSETLSHLAHECSGSCGPSVTTGLWVCNPGEQPFECQAYALATVEWMTSKAGQRFYRAFMKLQGWRRTDFDW